MKKKKRKPQPKRRSKAKAKRRKKKPTTTAIVAVPPPVLDRSQQLSVIPKIKQTIENLERIRRFVSQCLNIDLQRAEAAAKAKGQKLDEPTRKRLEIDWGTIPSVDKPFLMQPGAEKMMKWLQLRPKFHTRDVDHPGGHLEVICHVVLFSTVTGEEVFEGPDASCTTYESNYRYIWAEAPKPNDAKVEEMKKANMGRNRQVTKWVNRQPQDVWQWQERIDNPNIWNERNKVRQIGEKRGLVKCLRQMGAISAIFNADPSEWNVGEEPEDEDHELRQDYTKGGRRILVDGKTPSGNYTSPERRELDQKALGVAIAEGRWCERHSCTTDRCPVDGHTKQELDEMFERETRRKQYMKENPNPHDPRQNRVIDTQPVQATTEANPWRQPEVKEPKPARAKSEPKVRKPAGEVLSGTLFRTIHGTTKGTVVGGVAKGKVEYIDVEIGRNWFKCYRTSIFSPLDKGIANVVEVFVKDGSITGLKRIGGDFYEEDGKTRIPQ